MRTQEQGVTVRLLVFSGRPDPEWTLPPETEDALAGRLKEAMGAREVPAPAPPALGYRGFLVRTDGIGKGLPREFTVFRNVVTVAEGREKAHHWVDSTGIEDLLLREARREHGALLDELGVQGGSAEQAY